MTVSRQRPLFPDQPRDNQIVDKSGKINPNFSLALRSLFQACQRQFSNEGYKLPPLNQSDIDAIASIYTPYIGLPLPLNVPDISGNVIFDATNRVPKVFIITYDNAVPPNITAASWKTFQLI